jgi:spore coat protein CotH
MSVTFKRHYPLLILLIAAVLFFVLVLGDTRIIAYTTGTTDKAQAAGVNYDNNVALFDESIVHEITIIINPAEYEAMIQTYVETVAKDFFSADIVLDGVRINNVGIRLKGNSTLASIYGSREQGNSGPPMGEGGDQQPPPGFDGNRPPPPGDGPPPGGGPAPGGGALPEAETIPLDMRDTPYLIKFDQYEPGQRYQGYAEVAIRVRGHLEEDTAQMSSLLSRALFASAGLPVSQMAYAGVSLNGEDAHLYVIAEHVDDAYTQKHFPGSEGVLYKAQPQGNFEYHGEDPTAYAASFEQKTQINEADLAPLIDFIRFVSQATDDVFERDLPQYLDIDSFAVYLAINNLIVNMDSLGGNGNNYYLYYDLESGQFTVLVWDLNESLGQFWYSMTPSYTLDPYYESDHPWNHPLRARFLENERFRGLYESKYEALLEQMYAESFAVNTIERFTALFVRENASTNPFDQTIYNESVAHAHEFLSQRKAFLLSQPLLHE